MDNWSKTMSLLMKQTKIATHPLTSCVSPLAHPYLPIEKRHCPFDSFTIKRFLVAAAGRRE